MENSFGAINWLVLVGFLVLTTAIGHLMRGNNKDMKGFFLGGKTIPWWAISGSIVATQTSALTFISVPAAVFKAGGNLTYIQITFGFIIGQIIMAFLFLKPYYENEIYSPYEFMANRIGAGVGQLARMLFMVGAMLSQGVRLLSTALILSVVTRLDLPLCIALIGGFAIIWTLMGGITTVIWTDVIQFGVFTIGALFAMLWIFGALPFGLEEIFSKLDDKAKLVMFDFSVDPRKTFTLWTGLIGCTLFQLGASSIDQVVTQRIMCCKNSADARKAVCLAAFGGISTYLMLAVGLALVIFYDWQPVPAAVAEVFSKEPDRVFPYFLVNSMPQGVSGLVIASLFAAGISTLDSALAALSQTSMTGIYRQYIRKDGDDAHYLKVSKLMVVMWGIILSLLALFFNSMQADGLLKLGLQMPGYVYGSLLGIALLALFRKGSFKGVIAGTITSVAAVMALNVAGISFFWWYPVGAVVMYVTALFFKPVQVELAAS
jgi:SSS family transporter